MSDVSFTGTTKTLGNKHKLPLLSAKQTGIRLKSEDQGDSQITILTADHSDNKLVVLNKNEKKHDADQRKFDIHSLNPGKESQQELLNEQSQNEEQNKMNISREDLIRLLSLMKSELQSKEIALAAIKCEQLKRLINPVEISRSSLASTYIELQNKLKILDQNNNPSRSLVQHNSSASSAGNSNDFNKQLKDLHSNEAERECLNILNTLLELLDRHPLLALPRDSVYCLDYNCNELSTKNYLNLKIQHLDNLINQHRKFRYYMNECLKRSEQRYLDLTREYELDRSLRSGIENPTFKVSGKAILLKHIGELKENIEKEKHDKQTIVINLLNELLDERERSESLTKELAEKRTASSDLFTKGRLAEDRVLKLETEQNELNLQLKKQAVLFSKDRSELQTQIRYLENENTNLKIKLEQQEKKISVLLKTALDNAESKDTNQVNVSTTKTKISPSSGKPSSVSSRQTVPSSNTSASVTRSPVAPPGSKPSSPSKLSSSSTSNASSSSQNSSSSKVSNQNVINNVGTQSAQLTRQPAISKTPIPSVVSRVGSFSTEPTFVKVQPLFKSASVITTNQQIRSLKTSVSNASTSSTPTSTRTLTNNQPLTKPLVPAKPAQLLDHLRSSIN